MEKRTAAMNLQGLTWGGGTFESASRAFLAVDEIFRDFEYIWQSQNMHF
jgi:hypothetical protein